MTGQSVSGQPSLYMRRDIYTLTIKRLIRILFIKKDKSGMSTMLQCDFIKLCYYRREIITTRTNGKARRSLTDAIGHYQLMFPLF